MGPDLTETPRTAACPSCGALLRPDAPWCTLCFADLRPTATLDVPPPPLDLPPEPALGEPTAQSGTTEPETAEPSVELTWPCSQCATENTLSVSSCTACGAGFLSAVAEAGRPSLVLPLVGDLGRFSRAQRRGGALAAVAVLVAPLAIVTLLLTGSPPKDQGTTVVHQPTATVTP